MLALAPFAFASPTQETRTIPGGIISPASQAELPRGQPFTFSIEGIPQTSVRYSAAISVRLDGTGGNTKQFYVSCPTRAPCETAADIHTIVVEPGRAYKYTNDIHLHFDRAIGCSRRILLQVMSLSVKCPSADENIPIDLRVFETAVNPTDLTSYIAQGTRETVNIV